MSAGGAAEAAEEEEEEGDGDVAEGAGPEEGGGAKLLSAVALSGAPVLTLSTVTDAASVRLVSVAPPDAAATVGELGDVW